MNSLDDGLHLLGSSCAVMQGSGSVPVSVGACSRRIYTRRQR